VTTSARILEFDVSVDRERTARSTRGGTSIEHDEAWSAEHLVLAGLVRCTLTSMDYHARRAGLAAVGEGRAHGVVSKREDGLYAFVEVESQLEIELDAALDPTAVREFVAKAERGCFVGNSLTAKPRYRWTVNGQEIS
jgi:organic hydroperoxide reductase OsmC/OhrA